MSLEEYAQQANIPTVGMAYVADRLGNEAAIDRLLEADVIDKVRLNRGEDMLAQAALSFYNQANDIELPTVTDQAEAVEVARRTMGFVRLVQQGVTKRGIELFRPTTSQPDHEAVQFVADAVDYCSKFEDSPLQDLIEKYAFQVQPNRQALVLGVGRLLVSAVELAQDRDALKFVESQIKAEASRGIRQIELELSVGEQAGELVAETEEFLKKQTD